MLSLLCSQFVLSFVRSLFSVSCRTHIHTTTTIDFQDCTGGLCIRCCTDENCLVHQEQKARARWKEAVVAGTTEIQTRAKRKRARSIPPGRFREKAFRYMNDTIVLWDLRTVLSPPPPQAKQQHHPGQQSQQSPSKPMDRDAGEQPLTSTTVPASALAEYQEDLKTREDILRRSRKNNESGESTKTGFRRNYRGTKKRFRSVVEALYEKSLDAELII
jgi:hypothetical protein